MAHMKGRVVLVNGNGPRLANQTRRQSAFELVKVKNSPNGLESINAANGHSNAVLLDVDPLNNVLEFANALARTTTELAIAKETYRCLSNLIPGIDVFHFQVNDDVHEKLRSILVVDARRVARNGLKTDRPLSDWPLEAEVVKNRKPLYIPDLSARVNRSSRPLVYSKPARSYLCLPLVSGESVVGTITLLSNRPNAFGPGERKTSLGITNHAAIALDRTLQRKWTTSHRSLVLSKLYETIDAISAALDGEAIYDLIVDNLYELFNLDFCSIGLFNPGKTRVRIVSQRGVGKKVIRELKDLPPTLVHKVLTSLGLIEIPNVNRWPLLRKTLVGKDVNSLVLLPFRGKRGPLGVINMGGRGLIDLPRDQRKLLKQLSRQAAVSIEHILLHNETQKLAGKFQEMGQMILEMAKQPDREVLLKNLAEQAASLLESEGGAIYLMSEKKDTVVLEATYGMRLNLVKREFKKGLVRAVLKTGRMVVMSDYRHWRSRRRELDSLNLTCVMGVPLVAAGKILGVMVVHSNQPGRVYEKTEQKVLFHFARHAGAAIDSIGRAAEDKAITEITRVLTSEVEYTKLLEKLRQIVKEHLGYESFTLMNCDGKELTVAVESVLPAKRTRTIKVGHGVSGWVAKYKQIRIEPDVTNTKGYIPGLGFGSEIALPVIAGKEVIAVLDVESKRENAFRQSDVRILKSVAAAVATAIMASRARSLTYRAEAIVGAKGLEEVLKTIAKEMLDVCPAAFCHIMLREKGNWLRVHASYAARSDKEFKWQPQQGKRCEILNDPALADKLKTKNSAVFTRKDGPLVRTFGDHLSLREKLDSVLFVPLRGGEGQIIGLITLGEIGNSERKVFTQARIRSATAFASQAAVAIEREQLASEGPAAIGSFELRHEHSHGLNGGEIEKRVAKVARTALGAEVAAVFIQKQPGYLTLEATSGSNPLASQKVELEISRKKGKKGLTGYIASTGRLFNKYGKALTGHPAVKRRGLQAHIPSGYCYSLLAIPLKRREGRRSKVIGLLKVENKLDHTGKANPFRRFDKSDILMIRTLARYLEISLQNGELYGSSTSLHRLAQQVNSTLDFDKIVPRVLSGLKDRIPFDTCSLQLLRGDELKVVACDGFNAADKKKVMNLSFPLTNKFPNTEVIEKKRAVLHPNIRLTKFHHFWDEHNVYCAGEIRAWLGVPLLSENRPIGMLSIDSKTPSAYTEAHKRYAEAMAFQVSSAVANSNVYRTARSASDIVMAVTKEMRPHAILKKLARGLVDKNGVIGADSVAIYLYEPDLERMADQVIIEGVPEVELERMRSPRTKARVLELMKSRTGTDRIPTNPKAYSSIASRLKVRTTGALRLMIGDYPVGVLLVHFHCHRSFEEREENLLRLVADNASLSIEHARMFETIQRRFEIARNALVSVNAMAAWAHDARKYNLRLDYSLRLLRKSSHLLRPKAQGHLNNAIEYSRNIVKIPTPPGEIEQKEALSLLQIFQPIQERYSSDLARKQIRVEQNLKRLPRVIASEWPLSEALKHLTQNSIKALRRGGKITLRGQVKSGTLYLSFIDNGGGIKPAVRKILFERRVSSPDENEFGVGLLLSKIYLNAVNCDLSLQNTSRRGTVFVLSLPVAK